MCNDFQRSPNNSLWVEYTSSNESSKAPISPDLFGKKPHSIPREMSSSSDSSKIPQHHLPNKVSSRQSSNGKIQIRHLMGKTKTTAHSTYHREKKSTVTPSDFKMILSITSKAEEKPSSQRGKN